MMPAKSESQTLGTPGPGGKLTSGFGFYWDRFLTEFCLRAPLALTLLLFFVMLSGQLGTSYGVPQIILYEEEVNAWSWRQFWVGFAFAVITLECLFLGYLLRSPLQGA